MPPSKPASTRSNCAAPISSAASTTGMSNAQVLDLIKKSGIPVRRARRRIWLAVRDRRGERAAVQGVPRKLRERRGARLRHADERAGPGRRPDPASRSSSSSAPATSPPNTSSSWRSNTIRSTRCSIRSRCRRELIDGANKPNCGYLVDAYHFTRSGSGGRSFESVPAEKILLLPVQRRAAHAGHCGVRRPTDRLAPGKGIVQWREMLGLLTKKGYTGYLSYEAPNPELWARSPLRSRAKASS